jgi:hypothetical protein
LRTFIINIVEDLMKENEPSMEVSGSPQRLAISSLENSRDQVMASSGNSKDEEAPPFSRDEGSAALLF